MTTLERSICRMLDAILSAGNCDFWGRDLVIALSPYFMLASVVRERSEQQKAADSLYARRFDACTLCIIEDRARMHQGLWQPLETRLNTTGSS
jgi:hypothetical protein